MNKLPLLPFFQKKPIQLNRRKVIRIFLTVMAFGVSVAVLFWLVYRQKDVLLNYTWQIRPLPLAGAFLAYSAALLMVVWVWSSLLSTIGNRLTFAQHFRYYCISNLAKRLPGTVWYIAWRVELYRQQGLSLAATSLASGIELSLSIVSGVIVVTIFAIPILSQYQIGTVGIFMLFVFSLLVIHPRTLKWLLFRFTKQEIKISYMKLLTWTSVYALSWIAGGLVMFCTINVIYPLPFSSYAYVVGSWVLIGVLAVLLLFFPSNMGLNELGISLLLSNIMPSPVSVAVAIVNRVLLIAFEIAWALIGLGWEKAWGERDYSKSIIETSDRNG